MSLIFSVSSVMAVRKLACCYLRPVAGVCVTLCELSCGACGALITVRGVCTSSRVICFLLFAADCTLPLSSAHWPLGVSAVLCYAFARCSQSISSEAHPDAKLLCNKGSG
jgi:CBS-domain-containing membrane protein